jgi:hypothetical protein
LPLFSNRRVEEELERIRKANLPPEAREAEETQEREAAETIQPDDTKITAKDVLAMVIAAFSIVIPYAVVFIGLAALVLFLFVR